MKDLVEYMARNLVEHEDEVVVTDDFDGHRHVLHLDVAESDMGKVIGRGGRVARSIRTVMKAAAIRAGVHHVHVEIAD
jgi:predicted RNA-binding protein YlqC (UPF0109 family)